VAAFAAVCGQVAAAYDWTLVQTINDSLGDLPQALTAKRVETQRRDLAIVMIDEDTLRDYSTITPVPRHLLARLITEIDGYSPKVIGVDAIIERATEETPLLVAAIRGARVPVVFGTIDDRRAAHTRFQRVLAEGLAAQEEFIAASGALAGHVWLERRVGLLASNTDAVRLIGSSFVGNPARASLSVVIASAAGAKPDADKRVIAWLRPPQDKTTPLFAELRVPRHRPAALRSGEPLLHPDVGPLIRNRVVLIGMDLSDRDQHVTPLSLLDGGKIPGVVIHAQAVAQHLDGTRYIRELDERDSFIASFLVALAAYVAQRWSSKIPRRTYHFFHPVLRVEQRSAMMKASPLVLGGLAMVASTVSNAQLPITAMVLSWIVVLIIAPVAMNIFAPERELSPINPTPRPPAKRAIR
jgi:CHASE2 domain-containing sensor protein